MRRKLKIQIGKIKQSQVKVSGQKLRAKVADQLPDEDCKRHLGPAVAEAKAVMIHHPHWPSLHPQQGKK